MRALTRAALCGAVLGVVVAFPGPVPVPADEPKSGPAADPAIVDRLIRELHLIRPAGTPGPRDFEVRTPEGSTFRLAAHRGSIVLLNFWATWCVPCVEEMPSIERLARRYRERAFAVVAVSVDSDATIVPGFLRKHRLSLPVGLDPAMEVARSFGARALPTTLILDRSGTIAAMAFGPRAWDGKASVALIGELTR